MLSLIYSTETLKKDLEVGDKEKPVFTKGIYKDLKLLYDTKFHSSCIKKCGVVGVDKEIKTEIEQFFK